jgi:hypothetical protein
MRTFLATVAASLAFAPAALADTAVETLQLARDDCGGTDNTRLDWGTGATSLGCGNLAAGLAPVIGSSPEDYPTADDVGSFILDTTRPIVVDISVDSYSGPPAGAVGDQTVAIDLSGVKTGNKSVDLGSATQTTAAADEIKAGHTVYEFTLPLTAAQAGTYKSLDLSLSVDGAFLGGFVNPDGTSFVQLPIPGDVDASQPDEE